jgi:hypothetical protein
MTSESKRRKEKNNPHSNHGFALKESLMKLKRRLYFNSSKRQKLKKIEEHE